KRDRERTEERRHRRHHDRPEADEAPLGDRVDRGLPLLALGGEREVDLHDRVLREAHARATEAGLASTDEAPRSGAPVQARGPFERAAPVWSQENLHTAGVLFRLTPSHEPSLVEPGSRRSTRNSGA